MKMCHFLMLCFKLQVWRVFYITIFILKEGTTPQLLISESGTFEFVIFELHSHWLVWSETGCDCFPSHTSKHVSAQNSSHILLHVQHPLWSWNCNRPSLPEKLQIVGVSIHLSCHFSVRKPISNCDLQY